MNFKRHIKIKRAFKEKAEQQELFRKRKFAARELELAKDFFEIGADWSKEQTMAKMIKGIVTPDCRIRLDGDDDNPTYIDLDPEDHSKIPIGFNIKPYEKVRVLIIKEDLL